ncbi:DUF309 domain-containing protein [Metabacillus sp. GX 13764]|uniref:DUF309 domain-containing protein n=1 Tax=Metabacillus kandeliae TaxID=2900151 RepID=UPI001E64B93C|nr:DUF309 domain-containing protein [Metabacillus kandeliae]MCD7033309.1 DUF309 domain-containing protein [Metabacillus kandeliae]
MYPDAYIDYLVHFHGDRDYFECHEVLEEYWKEKPVQERKIVWVGLIQLAVALYHHRRGNFPGALRLMNNAEGIFSAEKTALKKLGLDESRLLKQITACINKIREDGPYESIDLPIADQSLLNECRKECKNRGMQWGSPSQLENLPLINRHSLRNREDVISERNRQKQLREEKRKNAIKKAED